MCLIELNSIVFAVESAITIRELAGVAGEYAVAGIETNVIVDLSSFAK